MTDTIDHPGISRVQLFLFAAACGVLVANIYYAQTLVDEIGGQIGLSPELAGSITTLTQLGYGAGMLFLVPLGDLVENRRLTLMLVGATMLSCIGIALSTNAASFLIASLLTGFFATGAQILVPLATHLARPERQGRAIGAVMSGLLTGIMLARPVASFSAHVFGWRAIFWASAAVMLAIGVALAIVLPQRQPEGSRHYGNLIASTFVQMVRHRALRMRATYQALLFMAFNLFWTAAPLTLIHHFGLPQSDVGWFALAGAGGALAAPIAGRLGDSGRIWITSLSALLMLTLGFLAADLAVAAMSIIAFAVTAIIIDAAVQLSQISGQKVIFDLSRDARARINAAYIASMFAVGALGSVIGTWTYEQGGWGLSALTGAGIGAVALTLFLVADRGISRNDKR